MLTSACIYSPCNPFRVHKSFSSHLNADSPQLNSQLASFVPATINEVTKIITSFPSKSCDLDPPPTILLKACHDVLIIPITDIINASIILFWLILADFKHAHVNTVLKKTYLTKDDQISYRTISNLSCISKVLEKVVADRLMSHIYTNDVSNVLLQSA